MKLKPSFLTFFWLCLTGLSALAQSYQTSFSDVKFDRAKGPATFSGGVEVDAASGAASLNIPFGPGIGERGLKFRPMLSMRLSPQLGISSVDENVLLSPGFDHSTDLWGVQTVDTLYQRGFGSSSISPGSLDLGTMVSHIDHKKTSYSLPGGGGGRALGQVPAGVMANLPALLGKFGFGSEVTVGYMPGSTAVALGDRTPYVEMGSSGHLIVGLRAAGTPNAMGLTDEVSDDIQEYPYTQYRWHFPRRMAVIEGDVAYEFHYVNHSYMTQHIPYLLITEKTQLYSGHYMLTRIRNRFGESIAFTYDSDGIGYTATWSTNPAVRIRVQVTDPASVPSGQPSLSRNTLLLTSATRIWISYEGLSQPVSGYFLDVSEPTQGGALFSPSSGGPDSAAALNGVNGQRANDMMSFDAAMQSVQPVKVIQQATQEEIRFGYAVAEPTTWGLVTVTPTVLSSVTFPTRAVGLVWKPYPFRMNYSPEAWGGMASSSAPGRPAYAYGVVGVFDSDGAQTRGYAHTRVTPTSNWGYYPAGQIPPDQWVDRTFYDAISNVDGSVSVHRFVGPPDQAGMMQDLAFIKTLEREVRYYLPGVDWKADLSNTDPASSTAYKWVVKDRFDVRTVGAPSGEMAYQAVPYPTRTRTWEKESQVLVTEEMGGWDSSAFGWGTIHRTSAVTSSPDLSVDYLSLAQQGLGYSPYPATQGVYRQTVKTFATSVPDWFIGRVKGEQTVTVADNTGFLMPNTPLPSAQPTAEKTFHASINRVESVALKGSDGSIVTTGFSYQGTSGLAAVQLQSATLTSPGLALSGQMGVSAYGYDSNGYLNAISQKPNAGTTLSVSQAQDELGRPTSQTDMNGKVQSFTWDAAGRLARITPPGETGTDIAYNDSDHRGITLTRGFQVTELRYNGFGELVLERRKAPDGAWTYRLYGYDPMGRKIGETVWQPGDGAGHEADWANAWLVQPVDVTVTTSDQTICKRWGLDEGNGPVCLEWQFIPGTTTVTHHNGQYVGASTQYDGRGRVTGTTDANGIPVETVYGPGTVRTVTVGAGTTDARTTRYENDAAGRLGRVTDALGQGTLYRYDGGDRLKEVRQADAAGREQVRTWTYNGLGWLTGLLQPESGSTTYSDFTVAGKPTTTNYAGRLVRMTPDWMGRPLSVTSDDGTVSQVLSYDTALGGLGKLASSQDGTVTTAFGYGGRGGRLDNLQTTVRGQAFTQTFTYDEYGQRTGGNTGHAPWSQTYHSETGLPKQLTYNGSLVADTPWGQYDPISWAIRSIRYGNQAVSSFDYGADQARLTQIVHSPASGGPLAQWVYTYDQVGNLTRESDLTTGSFDQYRYDSLNRLVEALVQSRDFGDQLQTFGYDAFGNRTSTQILAVLGWSGARGGEDSIPSTTTSPLLGAAGRDVVNVSFDPASAALVQKNQMPAATAGGALTGAVYDAQGNLIQVFKKPGDAATALTMAYDALGRVTSLGRPDGTSERYAYTAEGLRSLVEEWQGSTLVKRKYNLYNDGRQLVGQYEESLSGGVVPAGTQALAAKTSAAKSLASTTKSTAGTASIGTNPVITSPSGPITVRVGEAVWFSGSSPDGNGGSWAFGDGGTASGWSASHAYGAAGTYTAMLTTQVPTNGKCVSWGWDDQGNRVCNQYQTTWVAESTTVTITVLPNAPSIVSFTASPTTIAIGGSSTLNWNVSGASSVTLSGGGVGASGGQAVYPSSTTSYTLVATNAGGTTSATITVNVVQAPVISWFTASPGTIYQGDGSTLSWGVSNATGLTLDQGIGSVIGTNSRWVSPSGTTTYTLTATNSLNGVSVTRTAGATVTVNPRPTVPTITAFYADPATIGVGNGTTLRWNVTNSVGDVTVTLSGSSVPASGSMWVVPGTSTTYTLTATNNLDPSKSVTASAAVTVIQKPVISFSASPTSVNVGNSTTLSWSVTNSPTSVVIDNGIGNVGASGSLGVTPLSNTTYTITASNLGGTTSAQVSISVTQKPVIVSFTASPSGITKGRSSTLAWVVQGADSITLNGQAMSTSSLVVAPASTQIYTLVVNNSAGADSAQVTVTVTESGTLTWKRDILYLGTREAAEIDAAGMHVTMVDHLGSPRIVTGPTGQVESRQKYLPFGELLDQSGSSYITSKGYTNHEQTDTSGLIYMQARFYMPWTGRFTSPDPARDQHFEDTQSWNIYSYVRNSPILNTDPTGMEMAINAPAQEGADADQWGAQKADNENKAKIASDGIAHTNKDTYQSKSGDVVTSILNGDFKGAVRNLLQAWGLAVKDPEWVAGAALATAAPFMGAEAAAAKGVGGAEAAEVTAAAKGAPKPSPQFETPTNPAQPPPTSLPEGHSVRVMPGTKQYPNGYWVQTNANGQPVNPATGKPPANVTRPQARAQVHVPLPPKID
ncbi:RHS repeat-associated core domain-containing protein [Geothrix sp. 21YS21S-4]|uniref:RHS repeat-associated core domain-containing protein n=1 Tax=Geothrix sp. 21YS21S-4 TaxID=3068889 RepID=UPI0027B97698|nr:RHS repeat-associated core domain-containing protein [Geothrix sp. 21YS21S-4]